MLGTRSRWNTCQHLYVETYSNDQNISYELRKETRAPTSSTHQHGAQSLKVLGKKM